MGNVVNAVDRYPDIPADIRAALKKRMAARDYDEVVSIKRDSISGRNSYSSDIRDMHFGNGQICGTVSRAKWADSAEERGLVYCEANHCILVPTICRNVSRIARLPQRNAEALEGPGLAGDAVAAGPMGNELSFDAPAAGPLVNPTALPFGALADGGAAPVVMADVPGVGGGAILPGGGGSFGGGGSPIGDDTTGGGGGGGTPGGGGGGGGGSFSGGGGGGPIILTPVPEPSTYMLLLAGLGAVIGVARRRRPA